MSRVGTWTFEIPPNHGLEPLERTGLDVELPFQVGTHFALHLVDFAESEKTLGNDGP